MPARAYQASGLSASGAIFRLAVICLLAAVVGGAVEGLVSRWISLLLLFPLLLGGIVGFAASRVIGSSHMRAPWVAAVIAGVAGLIAQLAVHAAQYGEFRYELGQQLAAAQPGADASTVSSVVDQVLQQETGQSGFGGYLQFRAKLGTEIKKAGQSSGLKLEGIWFWILFAVNFLIAGGIAASAGYNRANAPYCEPCQRWYEQHQPVASGSADKSAVAGTLRALDSGVVTEVPAVFGAAQPEGVAVLELLRCAGCSEHEPQLSLTVITGLPKKQKSKIAYRSMLRPDEARSLVGAFAARAADKQPG